MTDRGLPCIYEMSIEHCRRSPVANSFRYSSYMWLFDVDRPPKGFEAGDHLDVRAALRRAGIATGGPDEGRILVLTNIRVLNHVFNPLTVYWCYDRRERLRAHVAEVHNTYGGRHAYVIPAEGRGDPASTEAVVAKEMYVSPFNPVDGAYRIRIGDPGQTLSMSVALDRLGEETFRAEITGHRLEATVMNRARTQIRYPAAPLRGRALIQWQGLRLWRRGMEVQPR